MEMLRRGVASQRGTTGLKRLVLEITLRPAEPMSEPNQPPMPDDLLELLYEGSHEETIAWLDELGAADAETRKRALRAVRDVAAERPRSVEELIGPVSTFLTDEDRAVRLTTAKLFVAVAQSEPATVLPVVDALTDRLVDDEELYYVRARCAEALGYVALDHPEAVSDPEILADFRIGLSFDEPEVKEKLAKALEYVALGDPDRLRHQVTSLAEHVDDGNELVRYHLTTALVAVGCEHPSKLHEARDTLHDRLDDENPYVHGRAAEALGLLVRVDNDISVDSDSIPPGEDDSADFVVSRRAFLQTGQDSPPEETITEEVGTLTSIREGTETVVEAMKTTDSEECPQCGLSLPDGGPPMCPRCGAPY